MTIKQQRHTASPACRQQINVTITSLVLAKTHQTRQMTNSGRAFQCHARHRRAVCKGNLALLHLANNNISPRTGTPPLRHFLHHRTEPTAGTLAVANMRHYALRAMSPQSAAYRAIPLWRLHMQGTGAATTRCSTGPTATSHLEDANTTFIQKSTHVGRKPGVDERNCRALVENFLCRGGRRRERASSSPGNPHTAATRGRIRPWNKTIRQDC